MKNPDRKARIREMLKAEGLTPSRKPELNDDWRRFKRQVHSELAIQTPRLEIAPPVRKKIDPRLLLPVAAVVILGTVFFGWYLPQKQHKAQVVTNTIPRENADSRIFTTGGFYHVRKREIRFLGGNARVTDTAGRVRIVATDLIADFRLGERVDMQIEHPLLKVTITGTEFLFTATATRGKIDLRHGSLAIDFKYHDRDAEHLTLKAPAQLTFSRDSHEVRAALRTGESDKTPLYRYELVNGETFFAHQLRVDAIEHRVKLLGGVLQVVPVKDIARVAPTERE